MSDDLSMQALDGALSLRAKTALFAGCDLVLHCNGDMGEMKAVAGETGEFEGLHLKRSEQALSLLSAPDGFDPVPAEMRLSQLMGQTS